jgi:hypothetical protein
LNRISNGGLTVEFGLDNVLFGSADLDTTLTIFLGITFVLIFFCYSFATPLFMILTTFFKFLPRPILGFALDYTIGFLIGDLTFELIGFF